MYRIYYVHRLQSQTGQPGEHWRRDMDSVKKENGGKEMSEKQSALQAIDRLENQICRLSDSIWDHPETGYQEFFATDAYCRFLEEQGFQVEKNLAGIKTAFSGTYGCGSPVIGILGEFDALPGLSQKAGTAKKKELVRGGPGHGCGHNLLGAGALAAVLAVKE